MPKNYRSTVQICKKILTAAKNRGLIENMQDYVNNRCCYQAISNVTSYSVGVKSSALWLRG